MPTLNFNKMSPEMQKLCLRDTQTLNSEYEKFCFSHCSHGYTKGRSYITNAKKHIGYKYTLSLDIKDFFNSINVNKFLKNIYQNRIYNWCAPYKVGIPKGLPVSCPISNIFMSSFDLFLHEPSKYEYTRYVDDLTFSFNSYILKDKIMKRVINNLIRLDLTLNTKKTKLQDSRYGHRIITGVSVGDKDIFIPRKLKRKIRAAEHQGNYRYHGIKY